MSADESLALDQHDVEFFGDDDNLEGSAVVAADGTCTLSASSIDCDRVTLYIDCPILCSNDDENLDDTITETPETLTTTSEKRKHDSARQTVTPTTADDINAAIGAKKVIVCMNAPSNVLLHYRCLTESLGKQDLELLITGKIDVMAKRGAVDHGGAPSAAIRARVTYKYSVVGVDVWQKVCICAHCTTRYTIQKVQKSS